MPYSVTSWFVDQTRSENPPVKRVLTIAGSDYSDHVIRWPSIGFRWNELRPNNVTISLANEDQTFNFFKTAKANTQAACLVKFGFTHPSSGDELITMLSGTVSEISFKTGAVDLSLVDKVQQLSDRVIGTSNSAAVFSSSALLPSDIAWTLCTCYGGLSSVQSTSNPDIDYAQFCAWAETFSFDNINVGARFQGSKVTEGLRKIMEGTNSAAFEANGKLVFSRWSLTNSLSATINDAHIKDLSISIKADQLVNKQWIEFGYYPNSSSWLYSLAVVNSTSISSYGIRENIIRDESFWFTNSRSALDAAQRALIINALPYDQVIATTALAPLSQLIGETLIVVDSFMGINDSYRIMEQSINLDTGEIKSTIDGSQNAIVGTVWTERTAPDNRLLEDICWGNSLFVAVGWAATSKNAAIHTSPDGVTWTARSSSHPQTLNEICWNNSIFCAVGGNLAVDTSLDGITWTGRTNPSSSGLFGLAWNGRVFCAVGGAFTSSGTAYNLITSSDGITWTARTTSFKSPTIGDSMLAVCADSNGIFYAVGGGPVLAVSSDDGVTWATRSMAGPYGGNLNWDILWTGSLFVACGDASSAGDPGTLQTSPDGITWTLRTNPGAAGLSLFGLCFDGYRVAAVGEGDQSILFSGDGIDWSVRYEPQPTNRKKGLAFNGRVFCAVGEQQLTDPTSDGYIITSR